MKKTNVALFVPHLGCPRCCSFCNQRLISGETRDVTASDVIEAVNTAILSGCGRESEIAFFGGSFTAIPREKMIELLGAAYPFVKSGQFSGIRISTRPDEIDAGRLELLKRFGVTAIELGAQSMDDKVLMLNLRGHDANSVIKASRLIRQSGFSLGLQMMTGLYGSDAQKDYQTFKKLVSLEPDTLRIYPTVILKGTLLAEKYFSGEYIPATLEETVELCAKMMEDLEGTDIRLIRLGLHSEEQMNSSRIAGPYHPAFGELCRSRVLFNKALRLLKKGVRAEIRVNPKSLSAMIGQRCENLQKFKDAGYDVTIKPDEEIPVGSLKINEL